MFSLLFTSDEGISRSIQVSTCIKQLSIKEKQVLPVPPFVYLVCDTHTTWSISDRVNFRNLFIAILLGSENPKRE